MTNGRDPKVSLRWVREGLVIVVSILLAFGIDAWWDDRGRAEEERTLITDLEVEFQANLQTLDSLVARHKRFPVLIAALGSTSPDEIAAIPPDSAQWFPGRDGVRIHVRPAGRDAGWGDRLREARVAVEPRQPALVARLARRAG